MKDKDGERVLSLCGTILNSLKLEQCRKCGQPIGPARYLDFVEKRTRKIGASFEGRMLCAKCSAIITGENHSEILS
jgi:hypothetical protein